MCDMNCIKWASRNLTYEEIKGKRVIEVGSYDVNGSLRYVIEPLQPAEYIGVDVMEGPGVDVICPAENLVEKFGKESFDIVVCTCVLEHVRNWQRVVSNLKNVCKPEGIIVIIVPSDWPFHEYPSDFWRYKREDMANIFSDCSITVLEEDKQPPSLVYAKIIKPDGYIENDLFGYKLYSMIVKERVWEINDSDIERVRETRDSDLEGSSSRRLNFAGKLGHFKDKIDNCLVKIFRKLRPMSQNSK